MKRYAKLRVAVFNGHQFFPDNYVNVQFLAYFPKEAIFHALVGFPLSPGEFPQTSHELTRGSLLYKCFAVTQDDRGAHFDFFCRCPGFRRGIVFLRPKLGAFANEA